MTRPSENKKTKTRKMIKRKPIPQKATTKHAPGRAQTKPQKPPPEVEEEDDLEEEDLEDQEDVEEENLEEDLEEDEAPKGKKGAKKSAPRRRSEEDDEEDEEESLAAAFDAVPASNNADDVKPGKYEAIISSVVLQDWDPKGRSVRMKFELCDPELSDQNQVTTWFKLFDADRQAFEVGTSIFKRTMAKLGYDGDDVKFKKLEKLFAEISEEQPGVIVSISYNQTTTGRWQRVNIDDLCDNDVVQAYKDNVAY
jgi:hypothetical protein